MITATAVAAVSAAVVVVVGGCGGGSSGVCGGTHDEAGGARSPHNQGYEVNTY